MQVQISNRGVCTKEKNLRVPDRSSTVPVIRVSHKLVQESEITESQQCRSSKQQEGGRGRDFVGRFEQQDFVGRSRSKQQQTSNHYDSWIAIGRTNPLCLQTSWKHDNDPAGRTSQNVVNTLALSSMSTQALPVSYLWLECSTQAHAAIWMLRTNLQHRWSTTILLHPLYRTFLRNLRQELNARWSNDPALWQKWWASMQTMPKCNSGEWF
ncbi:hypothetical protein C8J57DRAFT_1477065 [Mycena rebaudengoi]|nr:hypothetical protein C8J57DRAFT_1477065 [Mycena rebaudengoi]